jgi:hypothetical protein
MTESKEIDLCLSGPLVLRVLAELAGLACEDLTPDLPRLKNISKTSTTIESRKAFHCKLLLVGGGWETDLDSMKGRTEVEFQGSDDTGKPIGKHHKVTVTKKAKLVTVEVSSEDAWPYIIVLAG